MANIFRRIVDGLRTQKRGVSYSPVNAIGLPYGFASYPLAVQTSMQLSAVYRCVDVISDAIASQTWEVLDYVEDGWTTDPLDPIAFMLNNDPTPSMSRYVMMKTLMAKVLLEGSGYLIINRKYEMGDPVSLTLVNGTVKIFQRKDGTLYYVVTPTYAIEGSTQEFTVDGRDMIHILNFTYDGMNGVSTLRHAANTMSLAYSSEQSAQGFFSAGANMSGILQSESKLDKEKAMAIKQSWAEAFNITSGNPGGIAVMEGGLTFIPVTVNPKDAQMLETRKYNAVDICRFFGVHPSKVFDDSNLTYSNIESFQLGFITDTVTPWDCKIESEFNRKLFRPAKAIKKRLNLNINELLRANLDAKANYVSKMFQCGGYTVDEVRREAGNAPIKGGSKAYVPMSMIQVDAPITQNKKLDKNLKVDKDAVE